MAGKMTAHSTHTAPITAARPATRRVMWLFLISGLIVFALMGLLGSTLRFSQANWLHLAPTQFYAYMTLHGAGMITAAAMCGMGSLWLLIDREIPLDPRLGFISWLLIAAGVVAVIISAVPGDFAAGWTFLYPLPFVGAYWPNWATGAFLIGMMLVMMGWTLWCLALLSATCALRGGLRGALGWDLVFNRRRFAASGEEPPSPVALAACVVAIDGLVAAAGGMMMGVALLVHWLTPQVALDPLWAKNATYFFGHTIANLTIYMAIPLVYDTLPRYTPGREWHTSPVFTIAWWGTLVFVLTAYFHHLYMDFVQPEALQLVGEFASYFAAVPVAVVTVVGGVLIVYRSGIRWTLGSIFMYAGFYGWVVGGVGAALDATIPLNFQLHNTLWVPAHFHTYLLMGVMSFILGWLFYQLEERAGVVTASAGRWIAGIAVFAGSALLLIPWYVSGAAGVPRRYAVLPPPGPEASQWASVGVVLLIAGYLWCAIEAVRLALKARGRISPPASIQSREVAR